jgi:2,3-dihydro-2,3-dihydroxybenzoate dehydrogenase
MRRASTGAGIDGRVALVTGAGQGIGAAVARTLATNGASVALLDTDAAKAERVAAAVTAAGGQARAYQADVADAAEVERAVQAAEHDLGPPGILVNVAGVLRTGPVTEFGDTDWAATFAVNVTGVFHASRAAARRMVQHRSGVIVTVTSNAAGVPRMHMAAYAASKAAATMFTKCLGLELAPYGIRCNVVAPGSTDTPMQRSLWDLQGAAAVIAGRPEAYRAGIPLGRIAQPADIAEAVLFLASGRSRHITMHDLYVDGGAALRG